MSVSKSKPRLPPRWFIRRFWFAHRRLYRLTGGRVGLWRPKPHRWGAMRLNTVGRRTGHERSVMVGYFEDGPNLVTMAMNGWGDGENLSGNRSIAELVCDGHAVIRPTS